MTPEFVDWISPKYFEAIEKIEERYTSETASELCSALRMNFLANEATQNKIIERFLPRLDTYNEDWQNFAVAIRLKP